MMLVLLLIWFNHYMCFVIDITSDCWPYTSKVLLFGQSCVFTILPWLEKLTEKTSHFFPFQILTYFMYFVKVLEVIYQEKVLDVSSPSSCVLHHMCTLLINREIIYRM